jgi:cytochrome c biogenesis protein CcmG, thiol:disulfide interchange protein DsbE
MGLAKLRLVPHEVRLMAPLGAARLAHPTRRGALGWAAACCLGSALPAAALQVGEAMPRLALDTARGPLQLTAGQARVTYVDFWASWCGPCRQSFPWMNAMQDKYRAEGLRIVAVNLDAKRTDSDDFLARNPATFAIAYDRAAALAKAAQVRAMPTSMLLDTKGKVLLVHEGFTGKDRELLEAAIASALREGERS